MQGRIGASRQMSLTPDQFLSPNRPGAGPGAGWWQKPEGYQPPPGMIPGVVSGPIGGPRGHQTSLQARYGKALVSAFKAGGQAVRGQVEMLFREGKETEAWQLIQQAEDARAERDRLARMSPEERAAHMQQMADAAKTEDDAAKTDRDQDRYEVQERRKTETEGYKQRKDAVDHLARQVDRIDRQITQVDTQISGIHAAMGDPKEKAKRVAVLQKRRSELHAERAQVADALKKASDELYRATPPARAAPPTEPVTPGGQAAGAAAAGLTQTPTEGIPYFLNRTTPEPGALPPQVNAPVGDMQDQDIAGVLAYHADQAERRRQGTIATEAGIAPGAPPTPKAPKRTGRARAPRRQATGPVEPPQPIQLKQGVSMESLPLVRTPRDLHNIPDGASTSAEQRSFRGLGVDGKIHAYTKPKKKNRAKYARFSHFFP